MEYIKKRILRLTTTGTTSGCTGTCRVIVPNLKAKYIMKINLVQEAVDIGFFDAYTVDTPFNYIQLSGLTNTITEQNIKIFESVLSGGTTLAASGLLIVSGNTNIIGVPLIPITYTVTGISSSRLTELRKYTITPVFQNQYIGSGTPTNDGVDYNISSTGKTIYFIGGIRYVDILTGTTTGTTFSFIGNGYNNPNFINI